jgi:hypothetical protein
MTIVIFETHHLFQMELREAEKRRLEADPRYIDKIVALSSFGVGVTLQRNGVTLGVCGYYEMWPGVYEVWAFPSVHVERYAMIYLRTVKRYVESIIATHPVKRLQTTSVADTKHNRWMRFLGFTCETPQGMRNYSVLNETFNMWSLVCEGGS